MAGVMSMPVAWRTTRANAATTRPGPHATSSTVSSGPAPLHSTISRSAASSRMPGAVANGVAWRVNWSRISCWCSEGLLVGMTAFHDQLQVLLRLEHPKIPERVAGDDDQVRVLAGLDRAHARLDRVAHRGVRIGVGQDVFADGARFLGGRAHLADRELRRIELVGRRHRAAGGHDLDLVDVAPQLLANRLAHLGLA